MDKYLEVDEDLLIKYETIRREFSNEYLRCLKVMMKTALTSRNKSEAINQCVLPVLTYSFDVIVPSTTESVQREKKNASCLSNDV